MDMTEKDLSELSNAIREYIKGGIRYSHFSDHAGTTREIILDKFLACDGEIPFEKIRNQVMIDIDRELDPEESKKLSDIEQAWDEWRYIKPHIIKNNNKNHNSNV